MTEQQFRKLATLFSILLAFDVVILPSVIAVITAMEKNDDYNLLLEALLIYLVIFLVLGVFWIVGICEIYAVFFAKDEESKFFLKRAFIKLAKNGYRNNQLSRHFLILQTIIIWGGVGYIFLYETKKIYELLMQN